MKRTPMIAVSLALLGSLVAGACASTTTTATTTTSSSLVAPGATTPGAGSSTTAANTPTTVPPPGTAAAVTAALTSAYSAEQQAKATYDNVVARLGDVGPFTNVTSSEAQHVATVSQLSQVHGVTLPGGPFTGQPSPATLTAACQLGVTTEQSVIALYDQLLPTVSGSPDLVQAFGNLRTAAVDSHLPAFEHCA